MILRLYPQHGPWWQAPQMYAALHFGLYDIAIYPVSQIRVGPE